LCSTYNICDHPSSMQVKDGTGTSKSYTTYAYDEGGNTHGSATTISRSSTGLTGGPFLTQHYSYNTGGTLYSATDPNGTVTTYSYTGTSCNNAFPTSVTVQGLTTSYGYNCAGGVVTSVTDPNQHAVSTSYTDPYYWRPASVSDQLSNVTNYSYPAVGQVEAVMTFPNGNGGNSTTDVYTTTDNLGRPYLQQTREGPGSGNWETAEVMYDASGCGLWSLRPWVASVAGPGAGVNGGQSATTYSYDALNRYTNVTDWTGVEVNYSYNLNDTTVAVSPAPSGENVKTHQYEYDALGCLTSVCEATTATTAGCGQNDGTGVGYKTAYSYDPLGNLTSSSEAANLKRSPNALLHVRRPQPNDQ
jgi:uncharacterized protein RhaS with RHS repeats